MTTAKGPVSPLPAAEPTEAVVVSLRGPRADLRQRRTRDFVADLLDRAGAAKRVRALPEQEIAFLIRELGLNDSLDLLRVAAPEQIQACIDIDCWQGDRLDPDRLQPWLEVLTELGPANLGAVVAALDHELLVTFCAQRMRVYDLSCDEPPEEPQGHFYNTPDRFYTVDVLDPGPDAHAIDRILETLYMADMELARRVMMGARWDLGAETEEAAYRFRSGRLADLGYVDYYEALRIYSFLDPKTVQREARPVLAQGQGETAPLYLPPTLADVLSNHSGLLSRALVALAPGERAAVTRGLLFLLNQVLSAERLDPGPDNQGALRQELSALVDTLCLALEYLATRERSAGVAEHSPPLNRSPSAALEASEQDPGVRAALEALRGIELRKLFRLGHSLTVQVARLAAILMQKGLTTLALAPPAAPQAAVVASNVTESEAPTAEEQRQVQEPPHRDPGSLLDSPQAQVIRALATPRRPRFARALEAAPGAEQQDGARPFRSLRDIALTVTALAEVREVAELLVRGLGLRLDALPAVLAACTPGVTETRYSDILGTMVGNLLLQRPPAFVPLARRDLPALRRAALGLSEARGEGLSPTAEATVLSVLKERCVERSESPEAAAQLWTAAVERWLRAALTRLAAGLRAVPEQAESAPELLDLLPSVPGLVLR